QISLHTINQGIQSAFIKGRYQYLSTNPDVIVDVAHNPQAASVLRQFLSANSLPDSALSDKLPTAKVYQHIHAIFSVLADKNISGVIDQLADTFDSWHIIPVNSPRAMDPQEIKNIIQRHTKHIPITCYNDFSCAYKMLMEQINSMDQKGSNRPENSVKNCIVVFGSFFTVAQAMEYFHGA
ncbi:MAG: hypothetical protein QM504_16255, partial [Pseudomonadota bacterium]